MEYDLLENREFEAWLVELRRDFHRYPEPGWMEYRTTVKIIEELERLGIPMVWGRDLYEADCRLGLPEQEEDRRAVRRAVEETGREDLIAKMAGGFTGAMAVIEGAKKGPAVGIRVDIDSNELEESADLAHRPAREGFSSVHRGCMHGCGHDGHTAIGLGTARILWANRDKLLGTVYLFFQAAEEGGRGAQAVVKKGLLAHLDYFYGGHIGINSAPLGTISASTYGFMAGTKFDVEFTGRASHAGKAPEEGANAVGAAASAVLNLLAISRSGKGISRVNVGKIQGGSGRNVIPDYALLKAETRGGSREVSDYMFDRAVNVCRGAAQMYGCGMAYRIMGESRDAACDKELALFVQRSASELAGIRQVIPASDMGAGENITFMMNEVKSRGGRTTFMLLGADIKAPHHSAKFDFDEGVIPLSARLFAKLALDLMKK